VKASRGVWEMEEVNHEGLRARYVHGGWAHFRSSLHEPIISLTIESDREGGIRDMLQGLGKSISNKIEPFVDWAPIQEQIST
jgi:phosphomannomutase